MANTQNKAHDGVRRLNYPIRCIDCGKKEVRPAEINREFQANHDGRVYNLMIENMPVTQCDACGEVSFTSESDDCISAALREELSLLTPEQIRDNIESLGLTQKVAAQRVGVAAETMSRWVSGAMIQSRAMDNLLRAFFGCPEVREKLTGEHQDKRFGQKVRVA